MRKLSRTFFRVLLGASLLVPLLAVTTPAQAATPLIDAKFRSIRLMDNGSLQVVVEYICPDDGYRADRDETQFWVYQPEAQARTYAADFFSAEVVCDGTPQVLLKRVRPGDFRRAQGPRERHQRFDQRFLLTAAVQLVVRNSRASPGELYTAEKGMSFRFEPDGRASLMADMELRRLRTNDQGVVLAAVDYHCPTGWYLTPGGPAYAIWGAFQMQGGTYAWFHNNIRHIVCNDQTHTIETRMSTDEPLLRRVIKVHLWTGLQLSEVGTEREIHLEELLMLLPD